MDSGQSTDAWELGRQYLNRLVKLPSAPSLQGKELIWDKFHKVLWGFLSKKAIIFDKMLPIPNLHLRRLEFMMELDGEMHL